MIGLGLALPALVLGQTNVAGLEGHWDQARRLAALHAKSHLRRPDGPSFRQAETEFLRALKAATNTLPGKQVDGCALAVLQAEYAWFLHFYGTAEQRRMAEGMVSNAWHACPTNPVLAYKFANLLEKRHRALVLSGKPGDPAAHERSFAIGQTLVREHPNFAPGWLGLAEDLFSRHQTDQGVACLKRYLELTQSETNQLSAVELELMGYDESYIRELRRDYTEIVNRAK